MSTQDPSASRTEREIFFEALSKKTPAERAEYLDGVCGIGTALRRRLDQLCASSVEDGFMEIPLVEARPAPIPAAEGPGTVVGRYKLLRKIGEGGMGVVYLAEQEKPLRRQVALKVIKWGMDTRAVLARFEAERQALALMDHPNIARVLDGGATDTGRPYFAMELVEGIPITEYCSRNRLPIEVRLQLFLGVCQAVQHAHQKGVIHRDLKPSNVLVTMPDGPASVGAPKVIDFGVAKATSQRLTDRTVVTSCGTMIGTPAYMSPEQTEWSALDVDTRTDIYSLGVLLYELLTGTQPFPEQRLRDVGHLEMQRILLEEEPERPSSRLRQSAMTDRKGGRPPAATRALGSDLDAIVMKCLEKDRNRRYETASGLAADVQRHLNNEPVSARPPTATYRLRKFVRRHRLGSTAAALVLFSLILGLSVSAWALVRERASRRREQLALQQARQHLNAALGFVNGVVTNVAPKIRFTPGAADAQNALLQAALDLTRKLRASAADDPAARLAVARLLIYMAERQNPGEPNTLGDYQWGLERAQEALKLLEGEAPSLGGVERLELLWQGRCAAIKNLAGLGLWDQASLGLRELDPLLDQMERVPKLARSAHRNRMMIWSDRGWMSILKGQYKEALDQHLLPLLNSEWASHVGKDSPEGELQVLMIANDNAGNASFFEKRYEEMLRYSGESLRIAELLAQGNPANAFYMYAKLQCRAWHGLALSRTGSVREGLEELGKARAGIEERVDKDATSESFRRNRVIIAAIQALGFAGWSEDPTASVAERRHRVKQAGQFLEEAKRYATADDTKCAALPAAEREVQGARRNLETDEPAPAGQQEPRD